MPRFAMKIAYDGGPFCGFQIQNDVPSVQNALQIALTKLDKNCPKIQGAGRTDAGVHASGQVVHVDLEQNWDPFRLSEAMNFHLKPDPIAVVAAARVDDDFSARFSAINRRYLYKILCRRAPQSYGRGTAWWIKHPIDEKAMHDAAQFLVGTHDFSTFRSSLCQAKSPIKSVESIKVERQITEEGHLILVHVEARSFLHNQVRSFVGTIERVGAGMWDLGEVKTALDAKDRTACGPVAPPEGLYLAEVIYPSDIFAGGFRDY